MWTLGRSRGCLTSEGCASPKPVCVIFPVLCMVELGTVFHVHRSAQIFLSYLVTNTRHLFGWRTTFP